MSLRDFVRERVLTFPVLVSFMISLAKKSLQVSLNEFFQISELLSITKQAFSKARKKLSPKTFLLLNRKLVQEYYTDNSYAHWKGYRLIAIDGSDLQLPQKKHIKIQFGTAKNQNGFNLAMGKLSYAYDVLNRINLDAQLDRCKSSERDLAVRHIETIQTFKNDPTKDLYIFDRGYPALWFLLYLTNKKIDFLIRCCPHSAFEEIKQAINLGKEDMIIRLYAKDATPKQVKNLREKIPELNRKEAYVDIRLISVTLNTGEKELLITSLLDKNDHKKEDFKTVYNLRWQIEENYKWHKSGFELENFSGHTKMVIEQEIYALVFTANMASLLIQEAEDEIKEEHKLRAYKHRYVINKRMAIGNLKNQLMKGLLDPKIELSSLCEHLKNELKKNLCPVRPNRKFERISKLRLRYGCTTRRSY